AYDHYDSRAADPQLHTHIVVANRVQAAHDGKWRTFDSRAIHAAVTGLSEHYNAVLSDHLTQILAVGWEARERGAGRSTAWEIVGGCCCKQEFQITNYLLVCSATLVPDPPFSSKTRVCNSTAVGAWTQARSALPVLAVL